MSALRAYFFGNLYLSSIQQGIQMGHVIHELFLKYPDQRRSDEITDRDLSPSEFLWQWAEYHKTVVLLNAGYGAEIIALARFFDSTENPYPFQLFFEEQDALNNAPTCIGIILPEKIYETARILRENYKHPNNILSPRRCIEETGQLQLHPENIYGIETPEALTWKFNKWEYKLADRLNNYSLAR